MLLWQRSSNFSVFFFVAILRLISMEPTTPVHSWVASQWRERPSPYNGDHNSSERAGAPPVGRRPRTTTDDTFQVRADDTALRSTLLVSNFGPSCWLLGTHHTEDTFRVRVDALLFGAHSSSLPLVASVHRQLVIDHSEVELPEPHRSHLIAPHSASMLHSTFPRVASTSSKIGHRLVLFRALGL